ncbi:MAG: hypothetical protein ACRDZ7_19250 [Acidimicrobiia bacterium]
MHTRVITIRGVNDIDEAVTFLGGEPQSIVRSQRGYKGMTASADRSSGVFGILSLWATEADRDASDGAMAKTREEVARQFGTDLTVENFEERVVEISRPPTVGCRLLVIRFEVDPAVVDDTLEYYRREVVPQITSAPGFRTLRNMVNPQTGEGIAGSVWDDEATLQAAAEAALNRREVAAARGVSFGETSLREIVSVDLG